MANYTSIALVRDEIPDPPATLTDAKITQWITDHSAIVRGRLRNLPDSAFPDYSTGNADPLIERIVRFFATYDAMCFIGIEDRRFEDGLPRTYQDRAEAMLEQVTSGRYVLAATTPRQVLIARSTSDRLVTLDSQGYEAKTDD